MRSLPDVLRDIRRGDSRIVTERVVGKDKRGERDQDFAFVAYTEFWKGKVRWRLID